MGNDINKKVEEANMTLGDFESQKRKLAAENGDLLRAAGEINNNVNMLQKMKSSLVASLEEAKVVADNEGRERGLLVGKFRNLEDQPLLIWRNTFLVLDFGLDVFNA